ncbi:MAG: hypothetical protein KDA27_01630 [Candidatus Eisenbacteria bacterium]|uniref:DUF560 domain-containing protein n=1 Tax=Eiseniibacteriota bacterium TaxID=2212470 RepID=A0A956NAQ7_UNCEI|nr:hypothetical protein [Candidatus Eisenbacteria bacterium]
MREILETTRTMLMTRTAASLHTRLALCALAIVAGSTPVAASPQTTLDGSVLLSGGYVAHPLDLATDDAAGFASERLRIQLTTRDESSSWRLGYEGASHQLGLAQGPDNMQHSLGLEWFRNGGERRPWTLSTGAQVAGRFYSDSYTAYDFREATGYAAFRTYLGDALVGRGYLQLRSRNYGDLPEESYTEPSLQLELMRFLPTHTTLSTSVRVGHKIYGDPAAENVWLTDGSPTTSLLQWNVHVAQGVSERASIRASFLHRWSLDDFPHLAQDDLFDSPILDAYASAGSELSATLRILVPWQAWWEGGASYGTWDYGATLFPGALGPETRRDDRITLTTSLERTLANMAGTPVKARMVVGWRDQRSTLDAYDLSGTDVSTSLNWSW